MSRKFCWHPEDEHRDNCGWCERWHTNERYRLGCIAAREGKTVPGSVATPEELAAQLGIKVPCKWQGDILEASADPYCGKREMNHIRHCLHDDGPDRCMRGPSADPDAVLSCLNCSLHVTS